MTLTKAALTDREREPCELAFHESGHSVATVVLCGVLRVARLCGGLRHGEITGLTTVDVMPQGYEPQVAFAGVWSQARWRFGREPSQRELYSVLDGCGRKDRAVLTAAGGMATGVGVTGLLSRCWPAVATLAAQLWRDRAVRHVDVCRALGLSADPATAAVELAHIRAGAALRAASPSHAHLCPPDAQPSTATSSAKTPPTRRREPTSESPRARRRSEEKRTELHRR